MHRNLKIGNHERSSFIVKLLRVELCKAKHGGGADCRDEDLGKVWYGRAFIRAYYAVSPTLVKLLGGTRLFRAICKAPLDGMVRKLRARGFEDTPYEDKAW